MISRTSGRGPADQLGRDAELAVRLCGVVDADNVRMAQLTGSAGFAEEAFGLFAGEVIEAKNLQSDVAVQVGVVGPPDFAEGSPSHGTVQLEAADAAQVGIPAGPGAGFPGGAGPGGFGAAGAAGRFGGNVQGPIAYLPFAGVRGNLVGPDGAGKWDHGTAMRTFSETDPGRFRSDLFATGGTADPDEIFHGPLLLHCTARIILEHEILNYDHKQRVSHSQPDLRAGTLQPFPRGGPQHPPPETSISS